MINEKQFKPRVTEDDLYDYAEKIIMWTDLNDENDPEGRYWLACYRGCGEYRLFVQNGKIMAAIYGSFDTTKPKIKDKLIRTRMWLLAVKSVLKDRIGGGGTIYIIKADGSGTRFFMREEKHKKHIATREYDVPDLQNGGVRRVIEII